ncbi:caspase domain-containing protein [Boletus edulis BED1]|uniref:Caspase domain-containing protein n=1 Tax=Boletus edulis BED1 TaxID=1328754 RepID=A0AAD4C9P2_BOLED|nr:caspase domain-containing protein [Boletus edulis BED1]
MFALIIGIDDYINCPKLRGAVADAKAIKQYLEQTLQVPEDHIRTLFDREATRDAIIQAFRDLRNDERIKMGSPIVIFYAGHGGELPAPDMWMWGAQDNKIQCLLPQDYEGTIISPIPDRTVGSLIGGIAKVKGDNISVIFDCCHSASGTRACDGYVDRTIELNHTIDEDLDEDIWGERAGKIHSGFACHGLQSHVLLAACGEEERAYEHEGRGQFTTALLETLKNCAIDDLTYNEVLEHIHLTRQSPHCEGFNQHRIIFDARMPAGRQVRYTVRIGDGGKYVIGAGLAQGVTHGVEFTLYNHGKRKLGVVVVSDTAEIKDFQTTGTTSVPFTNVSFAKLTRVGNLPVYQTPGANLSLVFEEIALRMVANAMNTPTFRLVKEINEAKLDVVMEKDLVVLRVLDQRLKRLGLSDLCFTTTPDRFTHALSAAAHYYWYLDLTRKNKYMDSKNGVTVDFYLLQESEDEFDKYAMPLLLPIEPGLCKRDPNAETSDIIDFVVDEDALYGIKLTNNTTRDLYLNAFLFNNSSLSIAPYYTQSSIGNPKAPLKQNATFTIGYGPGGSSPFTYSLEEGQDVDIGYLKIFFATQPIDLSDIVQPPPFSTDGQSWISEGGRKAREVSPLVPSEPKDMWFTLDIPVVQRRA